MSPATAGKVQGLSNDLELSRIELEGKHIKAQIDGAITAASSERTIDGASTLSLTVNDPERILQGGRYYERRADVLYDDLWFRMVSVSKQGDLFTLTFEDREVAILRTMTKPKRQSRAQVTRAQFLQSLVAEVPHIGFVCPELGTKQQIAPLSNADLQTLHGANKKTTKQRTRARGIPVGAKITIKGVKVDPAQIRALNEALDEAQSLGAGHLATMAMIYSGIGESGWRAGAKNPTSTANGVLQALKLGLSTTEQAHSFMKGGNGFQGGGAIAIAKANPQMDPGKIADIVEGAPYSGHYGHHAEAQAILDAYGGIAPGPSSDSSGTGSGAYVKSYEFSRGAPSGPKGEDTWACGQRLASEVQWRWFIVAGVVYFISDYDLIRSEPRMTIDESTPGVNNIDYTLDVSPRNPSSVTIDCQATKWAAPPGTVVVFTEDMGPVAGAWIVSDIVRNDLTSEQTTITLATLEAPQKEPASQVVLRSPAPSKDGGLLTGPATGKGVPRTGGSYAALVSGLTFAGPDQGIDFTGHGIIYAPADLKITRVDRNSGWPGPNGGPGTIIAAEILSESPPAPYHFMYFAEAVVPASGVYVDATIPAGSVIATLNSPYPGCEIGFAQDAHGTAYGSTSDGKPGGGPPVHGIAMGKWIQGISRGSLNSNRPGGGART